MKRLWIEVVREIAPWALAGLAAWVLVVLWIPDSACRLRMIRAETTHLETIAPGPDALRERLRTAIVDSVARAALREVATRRQAHGSDPSSQVASLVVPRLEAEGVKLLKVSAREEGGEVLLSVSVQATWSEVLAGLASLDSIPFAWTTRRLSLRPADDFRLAGDLVLGVPTIPGESRPAVAP